MALLLVGSTALPATVDRIEIVCLLGSASSLTRILVAARIV